MFLVSSDDKFKNLLRFVWIFIQLLSLFPYSSFETVFFLNLHIVDALHIF
jgi:hypothetical protein